MRDSSGRRAVGGVPAVWNCLVQLAFLSLVPSFERSTSTGRFTLCFVSFPNYFQICSFIYLETKNCCVTRKSRQFILWFLVSDEPEKNVGNFLKGYKPRDFGAGDRCATSVIEPGKLAMCWPLLTLPAGIYCVLQQLCITLNN